MSRKTEPVASRLADIVQQHGHRQAHHHGPFDRSGVGQQHRVGDHDRLGRAVALDESGAGRGGLDARTQPGLLIGRDARGAPRLDHRSGLEVQQRQRHRLAVDLGHTVEDRLDVDLAPRAVEQGIADHQVARQRVDRLRGLQQPGLDTSGRATRLDLDLGLLGLDGAVAHHQVAGHPTSPNISELTRPTASAVRVTRFIDQRPDAPRSIGTNAPSAR